MLRWRARALLQRRWRRKAAPPANRLLLFGEADEEANHAGCPGGGNVSAGRRGPVGKDRGAPDETAGAANPGRPVGLARHVALPLQGHAARRRHVRENLRPLLQVARRRKAVLRAVRPRPVRRRPLQARRRHHRRKPGGAVRHLQSVPATLRRTHRLRARTAQEQIRLRRRRKLPVRPRKGRLAEERRRGARTVAQARQERLAAPEAGRQGRQGHPRHARQAL